ncbi:MAG TPA: antibiotic biosynthesis monooxygenase [Candidatus Binataceae bacterium]|nr:antibiotic biosynthesis monooxygenase [Candidatus Binataceae bacterium]
MATAADQRIYVVTHVDIMPTYTADGTRLIREFGADSRRDQGVVRFEVLQESSRPNHFTMVAVWADQAAFEKHLAADHTRSFRGKLQPLLGSPFDERLHRNAE